MKAKQTKPYWEMTKAELKEATADLDQEFVPTRPLAPAMKKRLAHAKAKRGRPRVGQGAASVLVSLERGLLSQADDYAASHNLSRSQLIARSLKGYIEAVA